MPCVLFSSRFDCAEVIYWPVLGVVRYSEDNNKFDVMSVLGESLDFIENKFCEYVSLALVTMLAE